MRMRPKCLIEGSGDAGAAKAPDHDVEMETEVVVTAGELSLQPDVVDGVKLPQPEAEFHTEFGDGRRLRQLLRQRLRRRRTTS